MQYHFHLIRNILKLPYCFPLETPSAPKSDKQAGGCQGPSVLGRVRAAGTKVTETDLPLLSGFLVEFMRLLVALSRPCPGLVWGPPGQGQKGGTQGGLQSRLGQMGTCPGASWQLGWEGGEVRLFILSPNSHPHPRQPHKEGGS